MAVLEDDQVVEVFFQRENEYSLAGSIHKGRVTRVLPGMQSAFVDIGLDRDAFLYVSDFFEDNEEYEKVVSSVEDQALKLNKGGATLHARARPAEPSRPRNRDPSRRSRSPLRRSAAPPAPLAGGRPATIAAATASGIATAVADAVRAAAVRATGAAACRIPNSTIPSQRDAEPPAGRPSAADPGASPSNAPRTRAGERRRSAHPARRVAGQVSRRESR